MEMSKTSKTSMTKHRIGSNQCGELEVIQELRVMFTISRMARRVIVPSSKSVVWGLSKTWWWQEEAGRER
jgi:hypothetical protein